MRVRAYNFEMRGPSDVSGLASLIERGEVLAEQVVCVLGKTEGNGGRNDFTRELAMSALEHLLAPRLGVSSRAVQDSVIFSFSGGTEGVVTPHMVVFVRDGQRRSERAQEKRLCVGTGATRSFAPEEIGRTAQVEETARAVEDVVAGMQVDGAADVHLIQLKAAIPTYTHEQAERASARGQPLRSDMAHSRGASALGVAVALGEVPAPAISDDVICSDYSLYSAVASCSAKPGLLRTEILAFGNSAFWDGDLVAAHGLLTDILDVEGIRGVAAAFADITGVFAKSEADPRGTVRGRRHTMLSDDDISDTRYSRCVLSSVLAATLGDTRVYVSTRAEHHGPLGGGPLAIIGKPA